MCAPLRSQITLVILLLRMFMALLTATYRDTMAKAELEWRLRFARYMMQAQLVVTLLGATPADQPTSFEVTRLIPKAGGEPMTELPGGRLAKDEAYIPLDPSSMHEAHRSAPPRSERHAPAGGATASVTADSAGGGRRGRVHPEPVMAEPRAGQDPAAHDMPPEIKPRHQMI